jgi:hypothetical protein
VEETRQNEVLGNWRPSGMRSTPVAVDGIVAGAGRGGTKKRREVEQTNSISDCYLWRTYGTTVLIWSEHANTYR